MNDTRQPQEYLRKESDGYWRYFRRVPKDIQSSIGKTLWRASLGRDKTLARTRAKELEQEHDSIIAALRDPQSGARVQMAVNRTADRMAELEARGAPDGTYDQGDFDNAGAAYPDSTPADTATFESILADLWKRVPDTLEGSEADNPEVRTRRLATLAAMAFGDQSRVQLDALPATPIPSGKVASMQHAAHKAMLDEVLEEIDPTPDTTPDELRLSGVLSKYLDLKKRRGNTEASYRKKVGGFLAFIKKDVALSAYSTQDMRDYRDHLNQKLKPDSVRQYFAALKTLWAWAPEEYDQYKDLTFPRVTMPERDSTVEDDRWQAFTDPQIKEVWRLVSAAWGPDSQSRLTASRRKSFLMATRCMLYTGLRPVEVWHLTSDNIEGDTLIIKHTKTKARRTLPLSKHIADLPDFLAADGFQAELRAGIGRVYGGKVQTEPTTPKSMEGTMRDAFHAIIRKAGMKDPKLVLYSLKDTLIRRLQGLDVSDDLMRGVIGHSTGQKALRNYKTPFGQSPEGVQKMRAALDAITYW
jgi:integrase